MFNLTFTTLFALFFLSAAVSGALVPRRDPPKGWWTAGLENYTVYHTRYLALGCQFQHGKTFFDECCHPLLKDQSLSDRPAECTPSAVASSSAAIAEPTSTVTTPADDDADCDDDATTTTVTSTAAVASATASGDDDDDECEDCEECDDGDDDDSTTFVAVSTTHIASSTHAAASTTATPAATHTTTSHSSSSSSVHTTSVHTTSTHTTTHTSSSAKASATASSGSGSFVSGGFATFFTQNGVAGACGTVHSDSDFIAAIDSRRYGNTGEVSSLCGKKAQIINTDNGKSVTVTIADACPTCENSNCMDLSTGAFTQIADESTGIVPIKWQFL